MIHFIRPMWLFALIPAMVYLIWLSLSRQQHNPWKQVCDPHLLPVLLIPGSSTSRKFLNGCLFLLFGLAIFALAGPTWKKTQLPIYRDISSIMLVLDLSQNMLNIEIKPDRLTRAKYKIRDLINSSANTQMGLVTFSGEAFVAAPLSQDANTLSEMIDELSPGIMPVKGADIGAGLTEGLKLLKQTAVSHSTVLLITGSEPSASSYSAAKAIVESGNQLSILAMVERNQANQALLNSLQQLANTGGGSLYLFTPSSADIQAILRQTQIRQVVKDEQVNNATLWLDAGPWFCLMLIPFALAVLREKGRYEKSI